MNRKKEFLYGKKILITGASGFIGSHLVRHLDEYQPTIFGITRKKPLENKAPIHWLIGNLTDDHFVRNAVRDVRPDIIFHLGSHVTGGRTLDFVLSTFENNLLSTVNLLTAAASVGDSRIVLGGSMEEPEEGGMDAAPCSPYAAAKWASHGYARMFRQLYKMDVITARIFMVYGPGQKDLKKLIPYVILSLLRGEAPKLTSGHRQIDWIYVDDVVKGLIAMACASDIQTSAVDLGTGRLTSIQTIVQQLVDDIDPSITPQFGSLPDRAMEQIRTARVSESTQKIGWAPQVSIEDGLKRTISWYRENRPDLS
jgi:nucleoside-diphosphate-sugar epimerase